MIGARATVFGLIAFLVVAAPFVLAGQTPSFAILAAGCASVCVGIGAIRRATPRPGTARQVEMPPAQFELVEIAEGRAPALVMTLVSLRGDRDAVTERLMEQGWSVIEPPVIIDWPESDGLAVRIQDRVIEISEEFSSEPLTRIGPLNSLPDGQITPSLVLVKIGEAGPTSPDELRISIERREVFGQHLWPNRIVMPWV